MESGAGQLASLSPSVLIMQSWIEEALVSLQLNPEYIPWLNHRFVTFKKDPAVAGKLGGELSRSTVEKYGPEIDGFRDKVGEDYNISEELRTRFYADFNAMGAAYEILKRFQNQTRLEFHQGTIPFPTSPAPAPIMGPEAELGLKQEVGDLAITDQTETTTTEPGTESSETTEASAELHEWEAGIVQINSDLLDPRTANAYLGVLLQTESMLDTVRDPWELKCVIERAEKLHGVADLMNLGRKLEMRGKALWFDALYKASQLFEPMKGRPQNGQSQSEPFDAYDKKIMGILRRYEPADYQTIRNKGVEDGTLSVKSFKTPALPKTPKTQEQTQLDPARFLIDYVVDLRQNLTWYIGLSRAEEFANDPRVLENLGPVVDQFLDFSIALSSLVRSKYNEQQVMASSEN